MSSIKGYNNIETHFRGQTMWQYKFYTKKYYPDITKKLQIVADENDDFLEVNKKDGLYEYVYEMNGRRERCDEKVAHIISDIVQKQTIIKVAESYLKEKEGLTKEEKGEIKQSFLNNNYLSRQEGFSYVTYYLLYLPIYEEIRERKGFNIDGWIDFRINKYHVLLKDLLEQFVEDYLSKKDVVTFIRLMREASMLAVPLEEIIHVVYTKDGKAQLYDSQYKNVTGHYIKKYCKELLLDSTLTREDYLLHVLITICPRKVMVHHKERRRNKQLTNTLEIIFEENVIYCEGCDFCQSTE